MVFNCVDWIDDRRTPKIHPTQKPIPLLEYLIELFTDIDDVVIDCCAGGMNFTFKTEKERDDKFKELLKGLKDL